jgi:hypothetical protein
LKQKLFNSMILLSLLQDGVRSWDAPVDALDERAAWMLGWTVSPRVLLFPGQQRPSPSHVLKRRHDTSNPNTFDGSTS